jgi:hypothetical protein
MSKWFTFWIVMAVSVYLIRHLPGPTWLLIVLALIVNGIVGAIVWRKPVEES